MTKKIWTFWKIAALDNALTGKIYPVNFYHWI